MPTYELSVGGKTYEIQADKDLSDADLAKHASSLAPQPGSAGAYPTPKDRDPEYRPKFGERVAREWETLKSSLANPDTWKNTTQAAEDIKGGLAETGVAGPGTAARGVADAALTAGQNTLATVGGGIAGLTMASAGVPGVVTGRQSMSDNINSAADVVRTVRDKYSTHPKTPLGRALVAALSAPVTVPSEVLGPVGAAVGGVYGDEAAGRTLGENAPALYLSGKALKAWKDTEWKAPEPEAPAGTISMSDLVSLVPAHGITGRIAKYALRKMLEEKHGGTD